MGVAIDADRLLATAERLVEYCREGKEAQGLEELYDPDCVSVEAAATAEAEVRGLDAIRGKHAWWSENFEMHGSAVEGPFPHGTDRFAVIFEFEATEKATGQRTKTREVAVYTINEAGKIVREEFFYRT